MFLMGISEGYPQQVRRKGPAQTFSGLSVTIPPLLGFSSLGSGVCALLSSIATGSLSVFGLSGFKDYGIDFTLMQGERLQWHQRL